METQKKLWSWNESWRFLRIVLVGVAIGITARWMNTVAPTLPVLAAEKPAAAGTNAPVELKSEGASPSARD